MRRAEVDVLWHTGLWPRFLLLTPEGVEGWRAPSATREDCPRAVVARLERLAREDLPEGKVGEANGEVSAQLGEGVLEAYGRYAKATMRDLLLPPSAVDRRLWGVYGRLGEQALKVAMLLGTLAWSPGQGRAPVIEMEHWRQALQIIETCRASAHRLPGLLESSEAEERETKVLMLLKETGGDGLSARDIYRTLHLKSAVVKEILLDLREGGLVEECKLEGSRATRWRIVDDRG